MPEHSSIVVQVGDRASTPSIVQCPNLIQIVSIRVLLSNCVVPVVLLEYPPSVEIEIRRPDQSPRVRDYFLS